MTYSFLLSLSKYAGAGLATFSSLWSATKVVSRDVHGEKRLTRQGKVLIGLTVAGLATTVISTAIQDIQATRAANDRATAELQRSKAIIHAVQPLATLNFHWAFTIVPPPIAAFVSRSEAESLRQIMDEQGERSGSQNDALDRKVVFYPFLATLPESHIDKVMSGVVVVLTLDNYRNAVLSFGDIPAELRWSNKPSALSVPQVLSGGVVFQNDLDAISYGARPTLRGRACDNDPMLTHGSPASLLSIDWTLDPVSLSNAIDKQNPAVPLTGSLPDQVTMLISMISRSCRFLQ
jgi:hypothetical protein